MTTIYWSKSKPGFYHDDVLPKSAMPSDVVVVPFATYQSVLAGQSSTQTIGSDVNGNPVLVAATSS
jgi:hypothetical protein